MTDDEEDEPMDKNKYWYLLNMERGLDSNPEESLYNIYRIEFEFCS